MQNFLRFNFFGDTPMKIKTILMTCALALGITGMVALPAPAHAKKDGHLNGGTTPDTGLYLGLYGGYGWTDTDTDGGGSADVNGWDYGVLGGYQFGQFIDNNMGLTLALEAFYGMSEADDEVAGVTIEKDHEWGVNFRPGFTMFNDNAMGIKPYGIVGYRRAEFEATGGGFTGDETYDGLELGLGTELVAYGDVGVRLEYSHVFYGEENGIDPSENDVRLGLVYHF
jgi:outer membrane immunogenic protein